MGNLFSEHFVAAHQQIGDFVAIKVGNTIQKNGGNVASHFLTPEGRLIHSVTGPVSAQELLEEANWALEMYEEAKLLPRIRQPMFFSDAHRQASMSSVRRQDRQVHELLAMQPLPQLESVYQTIFEKILGERVSKAGPRLAEASQRIDYAKKTGRPVLFVLHDGETFSSPRYDLVTQQLINEYVVIVMPIREAPALSHLTQQPPFEATGSARPIFVVAHSDCRQITSLSGWNRNELAHFLAIGWAESLEQNPRSVRTLVRAQRLLRKANPGLVEQVKDLTVRVQEESKAEREAKKKDLPKLAAG